MRVLLVEDDDAIADPLVSGLRREGFDVNRVATAAGAVAASEYEFVLLDLGLPDGDGLSLCRDLRATSNVPIIVVTARADEIDRVLLLELGADDYVVKPFGFRELVARMRAVVRRVASSAPSASSIRIGDLQVDLRTRQARIAGEVVTLTPKEFDVLALLTSDNGAVFARHEIMERVWDAHWYGSTKTLDVHVAALRRKLGSACTIETVRGVGFRVTPGNAQ